MINDIDDDCGKNCDSGCDDMNGGSAGGIDDDNNAGDVPNRT